jgi:hypothetical protein
VINKRDPIFINEVKKIKEKIGKEPIWDKDILNCI